MEDETSGVTIKGFVALKPKIYSFLVHNYCQHKKEKGVNKSVVEKVTHVEYKNVYEIR